MSLRAKVESWLARSTLQQQLQAAAVVISTLAGIPATAALLYGEYHTAREGLLQDLRIQGRIVAANSAAAAAFGDPEVAREVLAAMQSSPDIAGARLVLKDGHTLAVYRSPSMERASLWSERFELSEPVAYHGEHYGELVLIADYARPNQRVTLFMLATALLVIFVVVLAVVAFRRALKTLLQPVAQLKDLMRQVSDESNYSLRSSLPPHNELGQIAQSFNHMLEQVEQRDSALARELEERRQAEKRLAYLASHDSLTGLGNRSAFMQRMAREDASSAPLCLQLLDVDHFKLVNDSLGHHAGDELLVEIAARLKSLHDVSTEVFRIGGDEFAVLQWGCGNEVCAQKLADRITAAIGAPFRVAGHEIFTSLSIGVALCPQHASGAEPLLNCADLALYQAKNLGRDRWSLFSEDLKASVDQRMRLEADLRHAIERDELFLMFEPQRVLADGSLAGMEALVRWRHPEFGVLEPGRFIPLAEESGLIHKLGEWVLHRACRDGVTLRATLGPGTPRLAVNLSPRQLADPGIAGVVAGALAASGLPGDALELEVTESVMIEKLDLVSERMRDIAMLGVTFTMDDFGVGASSLSYLRKLPLSKIKIDRGFVRELPQNEDDAAVAAAITTLGIRLGIPVLAEGVETEAQAECLRGMGCRLGQGYLFARPQLLEPFMASLQSHSDAAQKLHA